MGCTRTDTIKNSQQPISNDAPTIVGNVGPLACEGQMSFLKTTTGDEIYIGLGGHIPKSNDYHIILTDTAPGFAEDGLVIGEIKAISNTATTPRLSTYISMNNKRQQ